MRPSDGTTIESACTGLASGGGLSWSWDARLGAALAVFTTADRDGVQAFLARHLPDAWDAPAIREAPEAVQRLVDALGGLRSGQRVLAFAAPGGDFLAGVWWPWGDGTTISVRVFGVPAPSDPSRQNALASAVRSAWGL